MGEILFSRYIPSGEFELTVHVHPSDTVSIGICTCAVDGGYLTNSFQCSPDVALLLADALTKGVQALQQEDAP